MGSAKGDRLQDPPEPSQTEDSVAEIHLFSALLPKTLCKSQSIDRLGSHSKEEDVVSVINTPNSPKLTHSAMFR